MTFYELLKRVYWALDEWIASSLGLGDYYGADEAVDAYETNEDDDDDLIDVAYEDEDDDEGDDMYKYHDHQA
jgi:hypothetical protein